MSKACDKEYDVPVRTSRAAARRRSSVRKFIVPRTSSLPHRPQFVTRFAADPAHQWLRRTLVEAGGVVGGG